MQGKNWIYSYNEKVLLALSKQPFEIGDCIFLPYQGHLIGFKVEQILEEHNTVILELFRPKVDNARS